MLDEYRRVVYTRLKIPVGKSEPETCRRSWEDPVVAFPAVDFPAFRSISSTQNQYVFRRSVLQLGRLIRLPDVPNASGLWFLAPMQC
jgi:hypothetical protein